MDKKFTEAMPILQVLISNGFEAYFVGGSVRDYLLQKEIHDVDIATSATPDEVMNIFPKHIPVGIEHGTVIVIENGNSYEITTFRTESEYTDYRRPGEVTFVRSLEEDLKRRDFTINAMAMTVNGKIIDLYNGQQALNNKVIQTVGNPNERFNEDALRMMRGIRFVSQLGFMLTEETQHSMKMNSHLLQKIAIERISIEFEKLLIGNYFSNCIPIILESNLTKFLPEPINYQYFSDCNHYDFNNLEKIEEKWALLLYILKVEEVMKFLKSWKLPRKRINYIQKILTGISNEKWCSKYEIYKSGLEMSLSIERVSKIISKKNLTEMEINQIYENLPIKSTSDICIDGRFLIEVCNRKPGSWIAEYIERIERGIIAGTILNTTSCIKEVVEQWEK